MFMVVIEYVESIDTVHWTLFHGLVRSANNDFLKRMFKTYLEPV